MMEMICASAYWTTTVALTLERKHRKRDPRLFDISTHMQRHTVGARGNATSVPRPWNEILRMLKQADHTVETGKPVHLLRSGNDLVHWAQVTLRTSVSDTAGSLAGSVHQARVPADVVVESIEKLQRRGHRS